MLSSLVNSSSAEMIAPAARLTASTKPAGSEALSGGRVAWEAVVVSRGVGVEDVKLGGGACEDHFHPGVSGLSSKSERISDADRDADSPERGSSSNVNEKPGMLREVCKDLSRQTREHNGG